MSSPAGGDVAIIGAGLIGLSIAFELSERGATVRVYERGEPGRAASWAGAGMLAPYTEGIDDSAMLRLCTQSLAGYPAFVERVVAASGIDPHLNLDGILDVAFTDSRFEALAQRERTYTARGVAATLLDRRATLEREPALASHVVGGLAVHGEGRIDNRRLGRALRVACEARGVLFLNDAHSVAVQCDSRRVLGIRTHLGFASAAVVINATGAWAAHVEGMPSACAPPVEPVKGQMLSLALPKRFVLATTWVPGAYLVPRDDGRLLVGATVERAGFDERVTAKGLASLLDAALAAAPALGECTIAETWAGLRPATPDDRPVFGPTPIDGLIVATGHYRNGILLTPETGRLIATYVATGDASEIEPFTLGRFALRHSSASG